MVKTFCYMLGSEAPTKLKKIVQEWDEDDHAGEVVVHPPVKVCTIGCTKFIYSYAFSSNTPFC